MPTSRSERPSRRYPTKPSSPSLESRSSGLHGLTLTAAVLIEPPGPRSHHELQARIHDPVYYHRAGVVTGRPDCLRVIGPASLTTGRSFIDDTIWKRPHKFHPLSPLVHLLQKIKPYGRAPKLSASK